MVNPFAAVKNSALKAWRGEERLWKVFWLWFMVLYPMSVVIGFLVISASKIAPEVFSIVAFPMGICGLIMVFVYPVILCRSMWLCAGNTGGKQKLTELLARAFIPLFLYGHITYSKLVGLGSVLFLGLLTK